jgi:hypothetical protein
MRSRINKSHLQNPACAALSIGLLAVSTLAQAHDFPCISNASGLQTALDQSSDNGIYSGEDNTIYLGKGNYATGAATGNGPFHYTSTATTGSITLFGGYADVNCSSLTRDPAMAVLDGNHSTQVLNISDRYGRVQVSEITIQNGESSAPGGGLNVNYQRVSGFVGVYQNIIQNNHTTSIGGGLAVYSDNDVHVQTNLIVGNSADNGYGAGIAQSNGGRTFLTNLTVYGNTTTLAGGTGGLAYGGASNGQVLANIFWNNTKYGLFLLDNQASLDFNDYGTLGGGTPAVNLHNYSLAPHFVDASAGNFHLAGDSPLLGISSIHVGGTSYDLDGNTFPLSGFADLGAYEETVFTDGFNGG